METYFNLTSKFENTLRKILTEFWVWVCYYFAVKYYDKLTSAIVKNVSSGYQK